MFVKLAIIACVAGISLAQYQGPQAGGQPAALYPAGVDPQSCPNYPDCSSPLVAISQQAAQQYPQYQQQAPQYQQQQYRQYQAPVTAAPVYPQQYAGQRQSQYSPDVQQRLDRGEYIGDGDYRGEGLAEALAPGYTQPQQYQPAPQYQAQQYQPAAQYQAQQYAQNSAQPAQIPAGVSAQACPNYPFCHA